MKGFNKAYNQSAPSPYDLANVGVVNLVDFTLIAANATVLQSLGGFKDLPH
jgi:hypothetical protein